MKSAAGLILFSILFFISCNDSSVNAQQGQLVLRFKNNSQKDLNNIIVKDISLGNLSPGEGTLYIPFENFMFDTGLPDEDVRAEVEGMVLTNHYRNYWCGTEKVLIDSGRLIINIQVMDTTLQLTCQNPPI